MVNLVYMAKPIYGGWVTFTAHLCLKYNCDLFKIGKRTEKKKREYGYGVQYQNYRIDELLEKGKIIITAVDKHYWKYLHLFPKGTILVVHDPTELKGKENKIVELIHHFKIITIRKTVQEFIKTEYNVDTDLLPHPFYEYPKTNASSDYYSLSISRIDFDKHTDLLLEANQFIKDGDKKIQIFGAENRLYVHHKLGELNFYQYWKGKFSKDYPLLFENKDILKDTRFVVDMSTIKHDGGGSQYTFLEAIYQGCVLILHRDWVNQGSIFQEGVNCLAAETPEELSNILTNSTNLDAIVSQSRKLLEPHLQVCW